MSVPLRKGTAVNDMERSVELPIVEPVYKTYISQGIASAVLHDNPSIRNWYLNQIFNLVCNRKFLNGFTSPEVFVSGSNYSDCPYLEQKFLSMQFLGANVHSVIRAMLDDGYYVYFNGIDDYYIRDKCWYHERHFLHGGLICGYDQNERTYSILSYDSNWIFRVIKTPQRGFEKGRLSAFETGVYGTLCAIKPKPTVVELNPKEIHGKLKEYLDSTMEKHPPYIVEGCAYGNMVYDYVAMYLNLLANQSIPYERMDRRVLRMIWEHKKVMLERLIAVENKLGLDNDISTKYSPLVRNADHIRMLYASHHMKQRPELLPTIRDKLIALKKAETPLLNEFVSKMEGAL